MKRSSRHVLDGLTALSALLCFLTAMLWARSYFVADVVSVPTGSRSISINSTRGALSVEATPPSPGKAFRYARVLPFRSEPREAEPNEPGVRHVGRVAGFAWFVTAGGKIPSKAYSFPGTPGTPGFVVYGPGTFVPRESFFLRDATLLCLTILLPGVRLLMMARERRGRNLADCNGCGYDLTGNVSGICPECGTPVGERPPLGPITHRGLGVAAALALLACVATAALWARSFARPERIVFSCGGERCEVRWTRGQLSFDNAPEVGRAHAAAIAYVARARTRQRRRADALASFERREDAWSRADLHAAAWPRTVTWPSGSTVTLNLAAPWRLAYLNRPAHRRYAVNGALLPIAFLALALAGVTGWLSACRARLTKVPAERPAHG